MFYHMGGRRDWGALGAPKVQKKFKNDAEKRDRFASMKSSLFNRFS